MTEDYNQSPQDIAAERGVLCSILIFEDVFDSVDAVVTSGMFYFEFHQQIYSAMKQLREKRTRIDVITLGSQLTANGHLEEMGGHDFLVTLANVIPVASHAVYYAETVRDKHVARTVLYQATKTVKLVYDNNRTGLELAEIARDAFEKIGESGQEDEGRWFSGPAEEAMGRHRSQEPEGIPTGFKDHDDMTGGLKPQALYIWAGRPGMGKTSLIGNVAEYVSRNVGPVAFFSLEMSEASLFDRMTISGVKTSLGQLRSLARDNPGQVEKIVCDLGSLPIFINANPSQSVVGITAQCRQIQRKQGLSLVIVDYLQLVEPEDRKAPREHQVGQISWRFKQLAKSLNVPVILLSQLNRTCESRTDKKPIMADLRDSGQVEQNADCVAFIYRPHVYFPDQHKEEETELIIPKNRFGKIGIVNLLWDGPSMTFKSFTEDTTNFEDPFTGDYFAS